MCVSGATQDTCDPLSGATPDTDCDGIDDDCDGTADDNYAPTATTCGVGACAGNAGQLVCVSGATQDTCDPLSGATPDTDCDGVDDDCDGTADDNYAPTPTTCGVGACPGNAGQLVCVSGATQDTCDPLSGATPDTDCDGVDDDCDGTADDNYAPTATTCGVGACLGNAGQLVCVSGATQDTCDPLAARRLTPTATASTMTATARRTTTTLRPRRPAASAPARERRPADVRGRCDPGHLRPAERRDADTDCDGVDDDCDGTADDGYVPTGDDLRRRRLPRERWPADVRGRRDPATPATR